MCILAVLIGLALVLVGAALLVVEAHVAGGVIGVFGGMALAAGAAFILWRYGNQVLDRPWLRYTVAIVLGLGFFYLVVAFGLGAAVTKLKAA